MSEQLAATLYEMLMDLLKTAVIVIPIIVGIFALIIRQDKQAQRDQWNDGVCRTNGQPWLLAYYTDNGARVYVSDVHTCLMITFKEIDCGYRKTVYTDGYEHEYEKV